MPPKQAALLARLQVTSLDDTMLVLLYPQALSPKTKIMSAECRYSQLQGESIHKTLTIPWRGDTGILRVEQVEEYSRRMGEMQERYILARNRLCASYRRYVDLDRSSNTHAAYLLARLESMSFEFRFHPIPADWLERTNRYLQDQEAMRESLITNHYEPTDRYRRY